MMYGFFSAENRERFMFTVIASLLLAGGVVLGMAAGTWLVDAACGTPATEYATEFGPGADDD